MVIRRKSSINKINYEKLGQKSFFGRDNLFFKSINLPKPQKMIGICNKFKIKKIIRQSHIYLTVISIQKL